MLSTSTEDTSAYDSQLASISANLGQWRGCKKAAAHFLNCQESQLSRWLRPAEKGERVIMAGTILAKLIEFTQLSEAEQRTHLA